MVSRVTAWKCGITLGKSLYENSWPGAAVR